MATSSLPLSSPSPSPSQSSYNSSQSISFLLPNVQFYNSRASRLKLRCSSQTVQTDTQPPNPKRKQRKPRPSFLDQIQEKWSVKSTSLRDKLPWQGIDNEGAVGVEEKSSQFSGSGVERGDDPVSHLSGSGSRRKVILAPRVHGTDPIEGFEEKISELSGVAVSGSERGDDPVSHPSSSGSSNKVILAPWVHGVNPRNSQFDLGVGKSKKGFDQFKNVGYFQERLDDNASTSNDKMSMDFGREVDYDSESEDYANFDEFPVGLSEENKDFIVDSDKGSEPNFQEFRYVGENERKLVEVDATLVRKSPENQPFNTEAAKYGSFSGSILSNERIFSNENSQNDPVMGRRIRKSNAELAEKVIPYPELKRLRNVALRMVERVKVGSAGITQLLVDAIHEKWKEDEVVKLKFEGPPAINMKRTHELLEDRTGGLVIWRSGSSVVLYRGISYNLHCVQSYTKQNTEVLESSNLENGVSQSSAVEYSARGFEYSKTESSNLLKCLSNQQPMGSSNLNVLLDGLGPRFKDWSGRKPLPVDADLLPAIVPEYKPPFRLLPHGVKHSLRNKEMTYFRQTARDMPPHFALGRNRELQGLAMAMVKLWEKSAIAKIAIKRGVHNTCNERMAEELKVLTGGTLLSRNKDYIVFYRGNDFLLPAVTEALVEAEKLTGLQQDEEEHARQKAAILIDSNGKAGKRPLIAGTLTETMAATSRWANQLSKEEMEKMMRDSAVARHASLVKFLEQKLDLARGKISKAENSLRKLQENLQPSELPSDLETLTDEERFLYRRMGLSMKPYLLLGRRGMFDGTVENMHLHWKYRELVKIVVARKSLPQIKHIAVSLEAESSGVLVSVDKTTKGHAIILYRGKNYQRPSAFRPRNLLTKRQALARSIELQRCEALKHHILELQEKIEKLKSELEDMKMVTEIDEQTLYSRLDASDDEDVEEDENDDTRDENDDTRIEKYGGSIEDEDA